MSLTSYHLEESKGFKAGDVVRFVNSDGGAHAFSDCLVLGFNERGDARLARPYCYASGVGTTGPTALTGVEIIDSVSPSTLRTLKHVEKSGHRRT